jgi:hypothetical protein
LLGQWSFRPLPAFAAVLVADLRIGQDISTTGSLRRRDGEDAETFFPATLGHSQRLDMEHVS